jgi:hypothetical protein
MATETSEETDTGEEIDPFIRSITVTTLATFLGMAMGVASAIVASGPNDIVGVGLLALAVVVQFPIYEGVGIDTSDFGTKDRLYVLFMTFVFWFVSWSVILTTESL